MQTLDVDGIKLPDEFPRSAQFRDYARSLVAESMLLLHEGKPLDAIEVDSLVFNLARQVASNGAIMSLLESAGIDSLAINDLRRILYREGENAGVAEAVIQALNTRCSAPNLGQALRGEVVAVLTLYDAQRQRIPETLRGEPGNPSKPPFEKTAEYREWTKKYNYPIDPAMCASRQLDMHDAYYLAWIRRILPQVDLPYPEALSAVRAILHEAHRKEKDPDYSLAAMSIQTLSILPAIKARAQARAETVRTAAALLAWKSQHGHFPQDLTECLAPAPLDPFDLRPLRYRREGEGFLLYSIGETGKFDGGVPGKKPRYTETIFRYPAPVYTKK